MERKREHRVGNLIEEKEEKRKWEGRDEVRKWEERDEVRKWEEREEVRKKEGRDKERIREEREEVRKGEEEEDQGGTSPVGTALTALRLQARQAARMRPLLTPSSSAELSSTLTGKRTEPINTRP